MRQAREDTGLKIVISGRSGAVGDVPWDYDERLIRVMSDLEHLVVHALEKHDLALSKLVRGREPDIAAIETLHEQVGLDEETLVRRYFAEMTHVGNRPKQDQSFKLLIYRLYGEMEKDAVTKMMRARDA